MYPQDIKCTVGARCDLMIMDEYSDMPLTLNICNARAGAAAWNTRYIILADGTQEGKHLRHT
jgi:hypothetical protein